MNLASSVGPKVFAHASSVGVVSLRGDLASCQLRVAQQSTAGVSNARPQLNE